MIHKLNATIRWKDIQQLVRAGNIKRYYSVDDQVIVNYNNRAMVWDIVAIDVATPADITKTHSMTLMAHYLLDGYMMFDNNEPTNSDSDRRRYGNNRYKDSNIRLWLNSDGTAGSWWTAQHSADAAPNYATTKAGFMNGFDADFLEVIGETKIKVVKPSVDGGGYEELVDKFYLPSTTEVGLGNENNIAEGALFPYFDSDAKRIKNQNIAWVWILRTPHSEYSGFSWAVNNKGSKVSASLWYSAPNVVPACNII